MITPYKMGLADLLKIQPFHGTARHNPYLNFPLQKSALQKFVRIPINSNYKYHNFLTTLERSSFSEDRTLETAAAAFACRASKPMHYMEGELTRRRSFAVLLLLSLILAASSASASSSEADFIKKTIASHTIVIFSKSYCPYCRRVKEVFKELKQTPHIIELDERDDGYSIQDALSVIIKRRTVPQVFINGNHIGGSDDTVEAYQNGELAKLLGIDSSDRDDL